MKDMYDELFGSDSRDEELEPDWFDLEEEPDEDEDLYDYGEEE